MAAEVGGALLFKDLVTELGAVSLLFKDLITELEAVSLLFKDFVTESEAVSLLFKDLLVFPSGWCGGRGCGMPATCRQRGRASPSSSSHQSLRQD